MAHKTRIGTTGYAVGGGIPEIVDGTVYKLLKGRTLVGLSGYDIPFGTPLESLEAGSSVFMTVGSTLTEFIVVHQGNPDSALYDESCDGTWLMMKDLYDYSKWSDTDNSYDTSDVHAFLNDTFLFLLDAIVQNSVKQVKIPYAIADDDFPEQKLEVASGENGLSTKVFLLSCTEVGWDSDSGRPVDGSCLSYFSGTTTYDEKRRATLDGEAGNWYTRSPYKWSNTSVWFVTDVGEHETTTSLAASGETIYIRPTMILPGRVLVDSETHIIIG